MLGDWLQYHEALIARLEEPFDEAFGCLDVVLLKLAVFTNFGHWRRVDDAARGESGVEERVNVCNCNGRSNHVTWLQANLLATCKSCTHGVVRMFVFRVADVVGVFLVLFHSGMPLVGALHDEVAV